MTSGRTAARVDFGEVAGQFTHRNERTAPPTPDAHFLRSTATIDPADYDDDEPEEDDGVTVEQPKQPSLKDLYDAKERADRGFAAVTPRRTTPQIPDSWKRDVRGPARQDHIDKTPTGGVYRKDYPEQLQQRRERAVTESRPFTPGMQSLNGLQTTVNRHKQAALDNASGPKGVHPQDWFHGTSHKFTHFEDPAAYPPEHHDPYDDVSDDAYHDGVEGSHLSGTGHWNTRLGAHFAADHTVADQFAGEDGRVVHARLHLKNPKKYFSEYDMDHEVHTDEHTRGNHITPHLDHQDEGMDWDRNDAEAELHRGDDQRGPYSKDRWQLGRNRPMATSWVNSHPDREAMADRFKQKLMDQGHDGILYRNEIEKGKGSRWTAVAFHPHQIETSHIHRVGEPHPSPEKAEDFRRHYPGHGQTELPIHARMNQAVLQAEAAGPQYANPGDHPWFKEAGLSHEHVLHHWDQATDEEKKQGARWYPDAHHVARAIAKLNPDIKDDKEAAHKGAGVLSAYSPQQNWWANQHNAARSFVEKRAVGKGEGLMVMSSHANAAQRIMDGEDHQKVLKGPKTADFAHLIEHGGNDEHGQPSKRVVMDRHALSVAAGRRLNADDSKGFPSGNRHYYEHAAEHYRTAAAVISDREKRHVPPHEVQAVTWLTRQRLNASEDENTRGGKGRATVQRNQRKQWQDLAGEHTPQLKDDSNSHVSKLVSADAILDDGTISAVAYGEIKAPQDVDTLREENCPVCGDKDTYDGQACQICGFISPPSQFRDPDLDMAKNMDLRKQIVDPSLVDNNGELQRIDQGGDAMPPGQEDPNTPADPNDPASQMVDPDQLDENGLPPSPYGDQALDGTQQGPGMSDRNGDGMIQPNEIDMDGNVNVQQDGADPEMGGQPGPRELPGWGKDRTGDPFTPGPDMPYRPDDPSNPNDVLGQDDDDRNPMGMPTPQPMMGRPGDGIPDLFCPSCGFGADATPPQTQNMGNPATDGIVEGDVCPSCQRGQLLTPGEINSNYSKAPAVERPAYS
ncbi:hypothetical protein [Streptomyces sp. NBC_01242]|uniref:DUF7178 family protein n=1 Tax=Streptomyces sp. NBC_01242 TaxID=2903795 RepID=UPI00338EE9C6